MTSHKLPLNLALHRSIRHWAVYQPSKPALITEHDTFTYAMLQSKIIWLRTRIAELSLQRQSPIGVLIADKVGLIAAVSAVLAEAGTAVLLNLSLDPTVIRSMVTDASCNAVIVDLGCEHLLSACENIPTITISGSDQDELGLLNEGEPRMRYVDDRWGILYSSGTTGTPKGIVRSDFSMLNEMVCWCLEIPIIRNSVALIGRPVYYTGGFVLTASTLLAGGSVILPTEWSVDIYKRLVSRHAIDFVFLIPDQVRELLSRRLADAAPWPKPRTILTMGAPIDPQMKASIHQFLECEYIESWGNSEGLGTITSEDDARMRPRSIGRPFVADDLFVVDEDGIPLPREQTGRIAGRTDSVLSEYQNREDLNRELIRNGMVISEDIGKIDSEGYFYLSGRVTQRIVRNGAPVFATDIEGAIRGTHGIKDIAVFGIEDEKEGEVPIAGVVMDEGDPREAGALLALVNNILLPEQRLASVFLLPVVPKNAAGKVDYVALRDHCAAKQRPVTR
jgi:acyl-coenzyme A synthetase/AMP-(fatty) acid ligase